jgi:hypothetical protein
MPNKIKILSQKKKEKKHLSVGDVAQWKIACLAGTKLWVQSLVQSKKKSLKREPLLGMSNTLQVR